MKWHARKEREDLNNKQLGAHDAKVNTKVVYGKETRNGKWEIRNLLRITGYLDQGFVQVYPILFQGGPLLEICEMEATLRFRS